MFSAIHNNLINMLFGDFTAPGLYLVYITISDLEIDKSTTHV